MGRMTAAEQRARAVLDRLPDGPVVGAEVGVFDGRMSKHLLARSDLTLHMVDWWRSAPPGPYRDTGDGRATMDGGAMARAMRDARDSTVFAEDRRRLHRGESTKLAPIFSDLDFAFIDADHSYEGVRADIAAWLPTLKPDGLLCGHDYCPTFPGVVRAVDEAAEAYGWSVEASANDTWFAVP